MMNKPLLAFTIYGLMIQLFGTKEVNINDNFSGWNEKDKTLYNKIRRILDDLMQDGKVECVKQGKKFRGNYWWKI